MVVYLLLSTFIRRGDDRTKRSHTLAMGRKEEDPMAWDDNLNPVGKIEMPVVLERDPTRELLPNYIRRTRGKLSLSA